MRLWSRVLSSIEGVGIALDAIRSNKVRAALTIMGVAVGVFVVVGMGAAIHGISASFESDVNEMGASTFMVRRRGIGINSCDGSDDTCADRRNPPVTLAEWRLIKALPSVQAAVPMFFGGMSVEETAEALRVSPVTVKRDWSTAKAWLHRAMKEQ